MDRGPPGLGERHDHLFAHFRRQADCLATESPDGSPAALAVAALAGFSAGKNSSLGALMARALGADARAIMAPSRVEAVKQILGRLGRRLRSVRCNGRVPWNELVRRTYSVDILPMTEKNRWPAIPDGIRFRRSANTQEAIEGPPSLSWPNRRRKHRRSIDYPYSRPPRVESWAFSVGRILPFCCFKEATNPAIALRRL